MAAGRWPPRDGRDKKSISKYSASRARPKNRENLISFAGITAQEDEKEKTVALNCRYAKLLSQHWPKDPEKSVGQCWLAAGKCKRSRPDGYEGRLRDALDRTATTASPNTCVLLLCSEVAVQRWRRERLCRVLR